MGKANLKNIDLGIIDIVAFGQMGSTLNLEQEDFLKLDSYVANGGGLLGSCAGWVWQHYGDGSTNKNLSLANDFMANRVMKHMGIEYIYDFESKLVFQNLDHYYSQNSVLYQQFFQTARQRLNKRKQKFLPEHSNVGDEKRKQQLDDKKYILKGITFVNFEGAAFSSFQKISEDAFEVLSFNHSCAAIAARVKKGKVFAMGHSAYFEDVHLPKASNAQYLANILKWLTGEKKEIKIMTFRFGGAFSPKLMKPFGIDISITNKEELKEISGNDIIVIPHFNSFPSEVSSQDIENLKSFVENGGAIIFGAPAWVWYSYGDGKDKIKDPDFIRDYLPNAVSSKLGFIFQNEWFGIPLDRSLALNLQENEKKVVNYIKKVMIVLSKGVGTLEENETNSIIDILSEQLFEHWSNCISQQGYEALIDSYEHSQFPPDLGKMTGKNTTASCIYKFLEAISLAIPPQIQQPIRPSLSYPGIAKGPIVKKQIKVYKRLNAWQMTGLYANPGEAIRIETAQSVEHLSQLEIIIGFGDSLHGNSEKLERLPVLRIAYKFERQSFDIASPYGGLIYIHVPESVQGDDLDLSISGAIEAPYFHEKFHNPNDVKRIQTLEAPWGIVECNRLMFVFPITQYFKMMNFDAKKWCNFWNTVYQQYYDLSGNKPDPYYKQVIMADTQISAGYMHSGNPVMVHTDVVDNLLGIDDVIYKEGNWGIYHEFGHNNQHSDWTFEGTGEVTCNIFTLYAMEKMHNIRPHPWLGGKESHKNVINYISKGANWEVWKGDPQLGLHLYVYLIEAFGWDAFKSIFREYKALKAEERPKDNQQKHDQWMVRFSRTVGHNLSEYLTKWGMSLTTEAKQSVASLPKWVCQQLP